MEVIDFILVILMMLNAFGVLFGTDNIYMKTLLLSAAIFSAFVLGYRSE